MPDDIQRLLVSLEARVDKYEKDLRKAGKLTDDGFTKIEKRAKRSADKIDSTMAGAFKNIGKGFLAGVGGALAIGGLDQIIGRVGEIAKGVAEIGDAAKRAGLSAKSFQELAYVARQNRVEVDALTDGMKELSLRADEYIVTGSGSAAASFQRLGYSAAELRQKLTDPAALLADIIDRVQKLDRAAQIRIFDELFGGTGGEQFVQLVDQGGAGIRSMVDEAHKFGAVMDDELISKADELDKRFQNIATTISTNMKRAVIGIADHVQGFVDVFAPTQEKATSSLQKQLAFEMQQLADLKAHPAKNSFFDPYAEQRHADQLATVEERIRRVQDELARRSFPELRKALGDQRRELDQTTPKVDGLNSSLGTTNGAAGNAASGIKTFADAIRQLSGEIPGLAEQLADLDAKTRIEATYRAALSKATSVQDALEAGQLHDQALSALASKDIRAAADRGMLDLIGTAEGTDKARGYNETLAYGAFTGGNRNLVMMSLDDIDTLQGRMLADPANTFNSSALGRYQITRSTLRDLRASLGLKGTDTFSPDLQDRLAQELLRRRGNDPAGLRNEWEGLRRVDDATIRRAYDGTSVAMPAIDPGKAANIESAREQSAAYAQIVADAKRFTAAQKDERLALDMTAVQAAKLRYEQQLLNQAQQAGITLTPQQRTEISKLATGMAEAEEGARSYAETQAQAAQVSHFFGEQAVGALSGILTGSMTAEDALRRMLDTLVQATLQAALLGEGPLAGLFGGTGPKVKAPAGGGGGKGILGFVGSLLGFAEGGWTGPGGKYDPAGVVHRGEFVMSADAVRKIGVANLDALHSSALKGYAAGGYVGHAPSPLPHLRPANDNAGSAPITINAPVTVNASGGTKEQNADLAKQVTREMDATMRGVVADELRKQMKNGNTIANMRRH